MFPIYYAIPLHLEVAPDNNYYDEPTANSGNPPPQCSQKKRPPPTQQPTPKSSPPPPGPPDRGLKKRTLDDCKVQCHRSHSIGPIKRTPWLTGARKGFSTQASGGALILGGAITPMLLARAKIRQTGPQATPRGGGAQEGGRVRGSWSRQQLWISCFPPQTLEPGQIKPFLGGASSNRREGAKVWGGLRHVRRAKCLIGFSIRMFLLWCLQT